MINKAANLSLLVFALGFTTPIFAQSASNTGAGMAEAAAEAVATNDRKHSILIIYGDDSCPEGADGEIVVCATQPESERYRVPKALREEIKEEVITEQSWGSRVEAAEDYNRITRPNSCSAVGMNGATGCASAALRQWHAERRAKD